MARAYYSTVLDHPADAVWSVIRSFGYYGWAGVPGETIIEGGRHGDRIGSVRRFTNGEKAVRQVLHAHSDLDRSYSYTSLSDLPVPARDYLATIRVTPVVDGGRAFVEWWATFDAAPDDLGLCIDFFENKGFSVWLGALREFMSAGRLSDPHPERTAPA